MLTTINKFPTWLYSILRPSDPFFMFYRIINHLEKDSFGSRTYLLDREITIREDGTLKINSENSSYRASFVEDSFHLLSKMKNEKKKQLFDMIFKSES